MHPEDRMMPGIPGARVAEKPLVNLALCLRSPGLPPAQEVIRGVVTYEHLKIVCSFGLGKCVCMRVSLGADP